VALGLKAPRPKDLGAGVVEGGHVPQGQGEEAPQGHHLGKPSGEDPGGGEGGHEEGGPDLGEELPGAVLGVGPGHVGPQGQGEEEGQEEGPPGGEGGEEEPKEGQDQVDPRHLQGEVRPGVALAPPEVLVEELQGVPGEEAEEAEKEKPQGGEAGGEEEA